MFSSETCNIHFLLVNSMVCHSIYAGIFSPHSVFFYPYCWVNKSRRHFRITANLVKFFSLLSMEVNASMYALYVITTHH